MLIDAHRIVRRQHGDRARQANALGARGGGGQRHRRRRHRVIRPMMFAEPEHIEADAIGELDLLEDVGEGLVDVDRLAGRGVAPGLDEGVSAELHEGPRLGALRSARIVTFCRRDSVGPNRNRHWSQGRRKHAVISGQRWRRDQDRLRVRMTLERRVAWLLAMTAITMTARRRTFRVAKGERG